MFVLKDEFGQVAEIREPRSSSLEIQLKVTNCIRHIMA